MEEDCVGIHLEYVAREAGFFRDERHGAGGARAVEAGHVSAVAQSLDRCFSRHDEDGDSTSVGEWRIAHLPD